MEIINAIGRRKAAVARIYLSKGEGKITINGKDYKDYFPQHHIQLKVVEPTGTVEVNGIYNIKVNVFGGGIKGQAEAVRMAISRALVKIDEEFKKPLKSKKLLSRDPREVERKKYGNLFSYKNISMEKPSYKELLDAGVHFGHLKRKWNPKMYPYIFMERKGIHIIDLNRTADCLETAAAAMKQMAKSGKKILFVATKKQARDIVGDAAKSIGMPYVTDRWLGGMMTNFSTIRRSVKKMHNIERMLGDVTLTSVTKKERLLMGREKIKMERVFGGIANLNRLPSAVFVVDIGHEHIAISEAHKLGMKTFAMVDTNGDPNQVDYPIPSNDDASKSISLIVNYVTSAIKDGLEERRTMKSENEGEEESEG